MLEYVKICGLKRTEDIELCSENGATAVGLVYNVPNSPRNLDKISILKLLENFPNNIKSVVILKTANELEILKIVNEIPADLYQVHCSFDFRVLNAFPKKIKKKIIIGLKVSRSSLKETIRKINSNMNQFYAFLLDNSHGTGRKFDFDVSLKIKRMTSGTKLIFAGGIDCNNVKSLLKCLKPYGIDASSSLESKLGVKDPNKIKVFLNKINQIINVEV
ncbi:MAG: hypothetical protein GF353_20375 [Candidatus Lokiarchaeota archaeon]|nr:hypothetical protein [Candidatus Lokiarchaeota archaeon]